MHKNSLLKKVASSETLKSSKNAIKAFQNYKKASKLIEKVNIASGKKATYKSSTCSTINSKFKSNEYSSTQKI